MKKYFITIIGLVAVPLAVFAADFTLPPGEVWDYTYLQSLINSIADALIWIGIIGAVITIVISGIMYFAGGFNPKSVDKAKGLFKAGITGTLIILAVGVIINTIQAIVTQKFFQ